MAEPSYVDQGAEFSPDRVYRYLLWRVWDRSKPKVAFVMLNPSTADETKLDPTLRRVLGYAQAWGYGGFLIANLFALRSTDPSALHAAKEPVGPENDAWILSTAQRCSLTVAGWGFHGMFLYRADTVKRLLANAGLDLHCLKVTASGHPAHPLYLRGDLKPFPFSRSAA